MTDIFQEVDDEVRRDKAAEFWKKYQNFIIAAAVLIVLASAGFRYWQYEKEKAAQAAGDQLQAAIAAFDAGKPQEAFGGLGKLAAEAPGGYRVLAEMTEAGAKAANRPSRRHCGVPGDRRQRLGRAAVPRRREAARGPASAQHSRGGGGRDGGADRARFRRGSLSPSRQADARRAGDRPRRL